MSEHVDVLIVGAGLSGIGAAAHLAMDLPQKSYAVLEMREASGGTWDLFRYPGVRSDSDMYTLGYRFKPWVGEKALADAGSILDYIRETAREYDVERHIRYGHKLVGAAFDTGTATWTVDVDVTTESGTEQRQFTADFLWGCTGYYDYEQGYTPDFEGIEKFSGEIVHPQHWPEELDHTGKRVVVIGSGATAVTLVPAMAGTASQVTMLQRSPTYVMSLPGTDPIARGLRKVLPEKTAYRLTRWKNVGMQSASYLACRTFPKTSRRLIEGFADRQLPEGYATDEHFHPHYDPWDERLCIVPDGDLFRAIRKGDAEVVTDTVETFTENGVRLTSGRELEADIVVTATGFNLKVVAGLVPTVDGKKINVPEETAYRAMMLTGVPNFAFTIGYTNASWTLKADLVAEFVVRLLKHLDATGTHLVVPVADPSVPAAPFMEFEPGYVKRSLDQLPRAGVKEPWKLRQNYLYDVRTIRRGTLDDGVLQFR